MVRIKHTGTTTFWLCPCRLIGRETYSIAFELDDDLTDRGVVDGFHIGNRAGDECSGCGSGEYRAGYFMTTQSYA